MATTARSATNHGATGCKSAHTPHLVAIGELVDGRFEIDRVAATGGMGTVFRAYDTLLEREVALKITHALPHEQTRRFAREVDVASRVQHPAIVGYVAHGKTRRGAAYLALEWLNGEDLSLIHI